MSQHLIKETVDVLDNNNTRLFGSNFDPKKNKNLTEFQDIPR